MLAESSFVFSPGSLCYADVYGYESSRCCTFPFFSTFFIKEYRLFTFSNLPLILGWGFFILVGFEMLYIYFFFNFTFCSLSGFSTILKHKRETSYLTLQAELKHSCTSIKIPSKLSQILTKYLFQNQWTAKIWICTLMHKFCLYIYIYNRGQWCEEKRIKHIFGKCFLGTIKMHCYEKYIF